MQQDRLYNRPESDSGHEPPTLEELFPRGERVVVAHPDRRGPLVAGEVVGYAEVVVVVCDDGTTRRAELADVEPEDVA